MRKLSFQFVFVQTVLVSAAMAAPCRYGGADGKDQNVLICDDGISYRGADGTFRSTASHAAPTGGVDPAPTAEPRPLSDSELAVLCKYTPAPERRNDGPFDSMPNASEPPAGAPGDVPVPATGTPSGSGARPAAKFPEFAYLVPANTDGDPSFQFALKNANGIDGEGGTASLIAGRPGMCRAATAAHVVEGKSRVTMATADFGAVSATVRIHPKYRSNSRGYDVAVLEFNCPNGPGDVKVLEVAQGELPQGSTVQYGAFKGPTQGVHQGVVMKGRQNTFSYDRFLRDGIVSDTILQPLSKSTASGDSGRSLLANVGGRMALVGILSGAKAKSPLRAQGFNEAIYSTNQSLDFLRPYAQPARTPANAPGLGQLALGR